MDISFLNQLRLLNVVVMFLLVIPHIYFARNAFKVWKTDERIAIRNVAKVLFAAYMTIVLSIGSWAVLLALRAVFGIDAEQTSIMANVIIFFTNIGLIFSTAGLFLIQRGLW